MGRPRRKRTPAQNARIWGLVSRLARTTGSSKDEASEAMRRHVREVSGQEHSSQLTVHQAAKVIERLQAELDGSRPPPETSAEEREPWGHRGPGPRKKVAITRRQLEVLDALYHQVGLDTRPKQMAFARRQVGVPWPQTQKHYDSIYGGLEAMALRTVDPMDAYKRAKSLVGHPALNPWQRGFVPDLVEQFETSTDITKVLTPHKIAKLLEAERHCDVEVRP